MTLHDTQTLQYMHVGIDVKWYEHMCGVVRKSLLIYDQGAWWYWWNVKSYRSPCLFGHFAKFSCWVTRCAGNPKSLGALGPTPCGGRRGWRLEKRPSPTWVTVLKIDYAVGQTLQASCRDYPEVGPLASVFRVTHWNCHMLERLPISDS